MTNTEYDRQEAHYLAMDAEFPDWEAREIDPEHRYLIDENDVDKPWEGVVRGYGGDHRVYFPGVDGE